MRKVSPQDIRDDFGRQLTDLTNFYQAGMEALGSGREQSTLTEHSLLAAAVAWEGFISDMFIGYINVDATRFKQHLQEAFEQHLQSQEKANRVFQAYGSLHFPAHISKRDIQSLANSSGNNITFPNFSALEERARRWLVAAHSDRFTSLTAPQKALIDAVIALRNHIAHRSNRSGESMNKLLAVGALHVTGIRRGANNVNNVGAWLKAVPANSDESRILTIFQALDVVGAAC